MLPQSDLVGVGLRPDCQKSARRHQRIQVRGFSRPSVVPTYASSHCKHLLWWATDVRWSPWQWQTSRAPMYLPGAHQMSCQTRECNPWMYAHIQMCWCTVTLLRWWNVVVRPMPDSNIRVYGSWILNHDWSEVYDVNDVSEKCTLPIWHTSPIDWHFLPILHNQDAY